MAEHVYPVASLAVVSTDRPHRYGKQLVGHLGRRHGGEWDAETGAGWIDLANGRATVAAEGEALRLRVAAESDEELVRLEDVVGGHLVRFGERDELSVAWERDSASR
ncbi:DUF2218 domain-containing protein [Segniliparus rugosus]|uniref:DUF2218 domain-containing protein n=1 Tax=Segniliparus rugosus (strain ATCC BAA-974 / DSM 45345 / CCUG 50838 / CIP 108380 / JCM 13579 / CDC 945) TaxID=679197 RepID=E5XMI1_SEGRC|nr:DUF2218 domain-containing protein [Segniliparus rugosus]EFV14446.1 hypothetical protein HMPREF9336_00701 [Segniliparus rugosus ATCC BAA-974]